MTDTNDTDLPTGGASPRRLRREVGLAVPIPQAFDAFEPANPRVFETLVQLAHEWVRRTGRERIGIGMLYERTRWEIRLETGDPDFKLNNNFRAYYARKIENEVPDLAGLFASRTSEADRWANERYGTAA